MVDQFNMSSSLPPHSVAARARVLERCPVCDENECTMASCAVVQEFPAAAKADTPAPPAMRPEQLQLQFYSACPSPFFAGVPVPASETYVALFSDTTGARKLFEGAIGELPDICDPPSWHNDPFVLPTDSEERKEIPIFSGFLNYFPLAVAAVARHSKRGNDKHNPGEALHWARGKSMDHEDCIARHLLDIETVDPATGEYLDAMALAWRAFAKLQELEEKRLGKPMSRGSRAA